ncbi:MAG: DMT family transporter [Acidobacteriota bacterium]|nr:DMT family transporter [Blastocatellia bacterium]MDW8413325.1 DMT family transporter [Acidobacteriota bacterium]
MINSLTGARCKVYCALLAVQLFFSLSYFATKLVLSEVPAAAWAALRVTAAAAIMTFAILPLKSTALPRGTKLLSVAFYSIFGVVINQICFAEGLARTTAAHSAIINSSIPVNTLLFAILLGRETVSMSKILSIALSFSGVLYLLKVEDFRLEDTTVIGDLLTFINSCSFALFLVLSKDYVSSTDPLVATALLMLIGSVGVNVYGLSALSSLNFASVSLKAWAAAVFVVVFATVLTYFLNYWALKRVESSQVAFFIYIQPLLAALISTVCFGEAVTFRMAAAAVMIFLGFFVSTHGGSKR